MDVQEVFQHKRLTASGAILASGGKIGGFLCTTTGTLKLTLTDAAGDTVVDTVAVTEGVFLPMPFGFGPTVVVYATLAGGAEGTFALLPF
jgi:hypothetical protein